MLIRNGRSYWPDQLGRVAKPHQIAGPRHCPSIAVDLNILTRKTLGGLQSNLDGNALHSDGSLFLNLFAAGEAAGFGGVAYTDIALWEGHF